jgi:pyridoxine kinase
MLQDMFRGLEENSLLDYDAILTGYTRQAAHLEEVASIVTKIRNINPYTMFICDPVLGDNGR